MKYISFFKNEYVIYYLLYFLSYVLILLNGEAIYWDGWVLYNHAPDTIKEIFKESAGYAGIITTYIHIFFLKKGLFLYRILTFIFFGITIYFVNQLLKSLSFLNKEEVFFITLLYGIAPLYVDRLLIINFPYNLTLFVFYLAFFLLSIFMNSKKLIIRIITLLLFFFSFLTNSLLVFYLLPLMYIYFKENGNFKLSLTKVINFAKTYFDFIIIPLLFFIIKLSFFKSTGLYSDYNQINILSPYLYFNIPITFYTSFIEPINVSLYMTKYVWLLIILMIIFLKNIKFQPKLYDKVMLILGIFSFLIGVYPYLAVRKIPILWDLDSRHQLLLSLPFSIMVFYLIKLIGIKIKQQISYILLIILITSFVLFNIKTNLDFIKDWFYRVSLMEHIKNNVIIKNSTTIIFEDKDFIRMLAQKRTIGFYEYSGLLRKAFRDDTRLGLSLKRIKERGIKYYFKYKNYPQYNYYNWNYNNKIAIVKIKVLEIHPLKPFFLRLLYYSLFDKHKFKELSYQLVSIDAIPCNKKCFFNNHF